MGKNSKRGKRGNGQARRQRQQERKGARESAAFDQGGQQENNNKGGIEETVLETIQERGEQHEAAFGSTGGGVPTPANPTPYDNRPRGG